MLERWGGGEGGSCDGTRWDSPGWEDETGKGREEVRHGDAARHGPGV